MPFSDLNDNVIAQVRQAADIVVAELGQEAVAIGAAALLLSSTSGMFKGRFVSS